ncbi:YbaB/EbfC family nucleoid-associated protein [Streptomyces sp. NPDC056796]|uniref:YbaB/EbfC family nucleoid-associated protein n=1 Tax=unclassified Streptomyces TaxID=2593676 RepID=UPI0036A0EDFA
MDERTPRDPGAVVASTLQEQLGEMTEGLLAHRDRLLKTQAEVAARTTTVRSKDRSMSVTVGARGDVREIKFHTEDYRRLDPARLGKAVLDIVGKAQEQAGREAYEAFAPLRGAGAAMRRSMESGSALEGLLAPLRAAAPGSQGEAGTPHTGARSTARPGEGPVA